MRKTLDTDIVAAATITIGFVLSSSESVATPVTMKPVAKPINRLVSHRMVLLSIYILVVQELTAQLEEHEGRIGVSTRQRLASTLS